MFKPSKPTYAVLFLSIFLNVVLLFIMAAHLGNSVEQPSFKVNQVSNIGDPFNYGRIHNHQWIPLDPEQKDYNLIDDLGEWVRDKTILLIGDSVHRNTVEWICGYKNWTLSTGSYLSKEGWVNCAEYKGCTKICTSQEYNLTIVNAFMVGLNPDELLRERTKDHFPTDQTMDPKKRIKEIDLPFIQQVLKRTPDLVVFNSGLWDLMHWTRKFVVNNVTAKDFDVVTNHRLVEFTSHLDDYFMLLKILFKDSILTWRDIASTREGADTYWPLSDLNYLKSGARMFRNTYIDSLNIAAEVMLKERHPEIIILPWNKVTRGEMYFSDDIHPAGPTYKAAVNMWLYFLKASSSSV